jgi:hypothetical protein
MMHPRFSNSFGVPPETKSRYGVLALAIGLAVGGYVLLKVTEPWEQQARAKKRSRAAARKARA